MIRRTRRRLAFAVAGIAAGLAVTSGGDALGQTPTCFGAAARDPHRVCSNRTLRNTVTPTPREARTLPNSPCASIAHSPDVCRFGVPRATVTVALVGDSHAGHWRGALDVVARAKGWRGLSITHSSCPLQKAVRDLPEPRRSACARWKDSVFAWFRQHPEVRTVFVAGLTGGSGVVPRNGRSEFDTRVVSFADAWRALPPTVTRIVVIRDTPKFPSETGGCITRAVARRKSPGVECAVSRTRALDRDPAMAAAERMSRPRITTVNLDRYFCDSRCYPVIGGVLVLRDTTHMTGAFSATLGPYLLKAVAARGL